MSDGREASGTDEQNQTGARRGAVDPAPTEPALWQFRFHDPCDGWTAWEEVKPRNVHTDTVETKVAELKAYIDAGYKYEVRALYVGMASRAVEIPEPARVALQAVLRDIRTRTEPGLSYETIEQVVAALAAPGAVVDIPSALGGADSLYRGSMSRAETKDV